MTRTSFSYFAYTTIVVLIKLEFSVLSVGMLLDQ